MGQTIFTKNWLCLLSPQKGEEQPPTPKFCTPMYLPLVFLHGIWLLDDFQGLSEKPWRKTGKVHSAQTPPPPYVDWFYTHKKKLRLPLLSHIVIIYNIKEETKFQVPSQDPSTSSKCRAKEPQKPTTGFWMKGMVGPHFLVFQNISFELNQSGHLSMRLLDSFKATLTFLITPPSPEYKYFLAHLLLEYNIQPLHYQPHLVKLSYTFKSVFFSGIVRYQWASGPTLWAFGPCRPEFYI